MERVESRGKLIFVVLLLLGVILAGCKSEPELVYPQRVSLEEASEILGVPVPYPAYLPYGYDIKVIHVERDEPDMKQVSFFISDEKIDDDHSNDVDDLSWKMRLIVVWFTRQMPPSMKCGGEGIWIRTDSGGCIFRSTTHNSLLWQWRPDKSKNEMFEFDLTANIDIPMEELASIARSVQPYWLPDE
jgi:hypothetical protein